MTYIKSYTQKISQTSWLIQSRNNDPINTIEIIVPVYNGYDSLLLCTQSLLKYTDTSITITFLNDASTDSRVAEHLDSIANQHRQLRVIHRHRNLGYLHNTNHYIKQCNSDVLLLNSDTKVSQGWLNEMREVTTDSRVGAVCPLSDNATLLSIDLTDEKHISHLSQFSGSWYPIPTAVGFCMLIKQKVLEKLGGFDPFFDPGYGEECDYSMLIRNTGLQVACAPAAFVFHQGSQSFKEDAPLLQQQHQKLLDLRWPLYNREIRLFLAGNPTLFIQQFLINQTTNKPRILHVLHGIDNNGGVELFTKNLLSRFDTRFDHVVLIPHRPRPVKVKQNDDALKHIEIIELSPALTRANHVINNLPADPTNVSLDEFFKHIINTGGFSLVHFHSLVGFGSAIWPLICDELKVPYHLFFHDHFGLCQIFSLSKRINEQEIYCGKSHFEPHSKSCHDCIHNKTQKTHLTVKSLMTLRSEIWVKNIDNAGTIYFSSDYLAQLYQQRFTGIEDKSITFHPQFSAEAVTDCKPIDASTINIAFLGQFGILKGAQMYIDLYHAIPNPNINWHIIGGVDPNYQNQLDQTKINTTGSYESKQLSTLLADIDLVVFTTQIPETYGITLSESWANGIPVIAPKLGAYAHRINHGINGWLYEANQLSSLIETLDYWLQTECMSQQLTQISSQQEPPDRLEHMQLAYQFDIEKNTEDPFYGLPKKIDDNQQHLASLLPEPQSSAYQVMQSWLSAPMTLEAAADWTECVDQPIACILGDDNTLVESSRHQLKQHLPVYNELDISKIKSSTIGEHSIILLVDAGCKINENVGNWLADFNHSQAVVSTSDFALCNQKQQPYAPQFQQRFSWHNFLNHMSYMGCILVKTEWITPHIIQLALNSTNALRYLIKTAYDSSPDQLRHFPYYAHNVSDVKWANSWKQMRKPAGSINPEFKSGRVLVLLEFNLDPRILKQQLQRQTILPTMTLVTYRSKDKHMTLSKSEYHHFEYVMLLNDNLRFTEPNVINNLLCQLDNSSLDAVSISSINLHNKGVMVGKKWGAENHLVGTGRVHNTALLTPGAAIEYDLADDDCIVFKQKTWLNLYQYIADNNDYYLPVNLANWFQNKGYSMGLCDISGWHKSGLPSAQFTAVNSLALQRQQLIKDQLHFPKDPLYSAALDCRRGSGLDLRLTAFKTPKRLPRVVAYAQDDWASSFYRVKSPLLALAAANKTSIHFMPPAKDRHTPTPYEIHRMKADVMLLHHFYSDQQLAALAQYKKQLGVKIILSTDDLLVNIPEYNSFKKRTPKDIKTRIKLACELADAVVVSTNQLADYFSQFHPCVSVVPNRLSQSIWSNLKNHRPNAKRLRIGWSGAGQHQGDLALLKPIIDATIDDVDWVFLGDKPEKINSQSIEFHPAVSLIDYPSVLSKLNLDLAVAPLINNPFNRAKSNLKLLEYGVLGIAVMASDLPCYRNSPATTLANDADLWIKQIKRFDNNRELLTQQGQAMQQWVCQNYWLEDHLEQWEAVLGINI